MAKPGYGPFGLYLLALCSFFLGSLLVRMSVRAGWLPSWLNVVVAVATVVPFFVAALVFRRVLRRDLDELAQRVVLEGFAFSLAIFVPLAALYTNLANAGVPVPRIDPPDLVLTPAALVALGIMLAWRRYQ